MKKKKREKKEKSKIIQIIFREDWSEFIKAIAIEIKSNESNFP